MGPRSVASLPRFDALLTNPVCTTRPITGTAKGHKPAPPPPPHRGRRDRMRVPKISGKGVLFVRQSPAREL